MPTVPPIATGASGTTPEGTGGDGAGFGPGAFVAALTVLVSAVLLPRDR